MPKRLNSSPRCALTPIMAVALALCAVSTASAQEPSLRVGLVRFYSSIKTLTVSAAGAYTVAYPDGQRTVSDGSPSVFSLNPAGILVEDRCAEVTRVASAITVSPAAPGVSLKIASRGRHTKEYKGSIEISAKRGSILLVNVVGLEDYVRGVLPEEMPASYPLEALKAQAVAARTYALANRGKRKSEGYDLCDTNMCQHYGGASAEKARCSQAIEETRGIVLLYGGRPAQVMYSTDCGGATQDCSEARPGVSIPYLCCVKEPPDIPHSEWEIKTTLRELESKLTAAGVKQAQGLIAIRVSSVGPSGRIVELEITGNLGTSALGGHKLRSALGSHTLRSTLCTIEVANDGSVTIKGKGWGHGHGLCQVGSRALAQPPHDYTFEQILRHYFPGTQLSAAPTVASIQEPNSAAASRSATTQGTKPAQERKIEVTPAPSARPSPATEQDHPNDGVGLRVRLKDPGHL